jgi:hypothetical protein
MHSEKCCVCNGHGRTRTPTGLPERNEAIVTCHGCRGNGWITVTDAIDLLILATPAQSDKPAPHKRVYLSYGLAQRLIEDGRQYKGRTTDEGYELTEIWIGNLCLADPEAKR